MKPAPLFAVAALSLGACTTTSGPTTSWGKAGVSMQEYRIDGGQCAVMAATARPGGNSANTAGGINGSNPATPTGGAGQAAAATGSNSQSSGDAGGGGLPTGEGGFYRESASQDVVSRAAMQQRTQEMAEQRARAQALKDCLTARGYKEFKLTSEQRAHLAKLPQGSEERRNYLYQLATDPAVLATAGD